VARALLIAATAAAAALGAGCYDPTFDDCTTTCSTSNLCPDGLTCNGGYCRTAGATGGCEGNIMRCPPMPPLQCGSATSVELDPPNCFAVCAPVDGMSTGSAALSFAVNTWHAAVLDDPAKQAAARTATGGTTTWIALHQQTAQATPDAGWQWQRGSAAGTAATMTDWATGQPDDGDAVENDIEDCGALTSTGWIDEACGTSHPFLIQP
jgi:hypothetical protein